MFTGFSTRKVAYYYPAAIRRSLLFALLLALLPVAGCGQNDGNNPTTYDRMLRALYRNTVPVIQPARLATMLKKPESVLLLDTRTSAEYRVSHLHNAHFVDYDSFVKQTFSGVPRNQTVVVYCSVGYRSERVGEHLKALGFRDVRNLYGGIFQWVNEGRPVYNAQGLTQDVHPYSPLWRPWLKSGRQVYQ